MPVGRGSASRPARWPGRVDIRVIDRGPGIRRQDRDAVFQPFQRLGDSDNRVGVGLGLAVARGFVEAVGGDLDIEDTPGGGCTMVVRIPERQAGDRGTSGQRPARLDPNRSRSRTWPAPLRPPASSAS